MKAKSAIIKNRAYTIIFAKVYPLYVAKAEKKGRLKAEVDEVIRWLTGYSQRGLEAQIEKNTDLETFFAEAPKLNPSRTLIKGVICGVRLETSKSRPCGKFAIWISLLMSWQREKRWRRFCGSNYLQQRHEPSSRKIANCDEIRDGEPPVTS